MLAGGVPAVLATPSNRMADTTVYRAHVGDILENAGASVLYCEDAVADLFAEEGDRELLNRKQKPHPRRPRVVDVLLLGELRWTWLCRFGTFSGTTCQ